ncbi:MAG: PEP-CTERM sorting domain-containing protein [Planctomycetia bacterium]|nr:PEP-CTERM sorting domain-containing protein [Planctomycetia bacterium]
MKTRWSIFLAVVFSTISTVWGGYLWNGATSGAYSGTTNWTEDVSLTGKWITSGTITFTDNPVIIGNSAIDSQLSIEGATVTASASEGLQLANESYKTADLYVGAGGQVTVATVLSTGTVTGSTSNITVEKGGKISAWQATISREAGNTTLKIDGTGSSVTVTGYTALGNRSTGTTTAEVLNGGLFQVGYLEGAKSAGTANITVSGEGSLLKAGSTTSSLNGGSLTVTDQAQAIFNGRLYFGRDFEGGTPGQTKTTIDVEVSEGGLLQAGGFWFGQRENTINVTISSGGKLYDTGSSHGTMYVGDHAGSTAVIDIAGGTLQADKNINVGQSGNGTIRVSQGGSLTAGQIIVRAGTGKGLLEIVGKDVSVKTIASSETTGNFTTKGTLHFLADSTGLGCLEVGGTYSQSGTVALGVAGGLTCLSKSVADAEYTLLNAAEGSSAFNITNSSLWKTTGTNNWTVQLDETKSAGTLSLNTGTLAITDDYQTAGYLDFTGEGGYFNLQLSFDGLSDMNATQELVDWMAATYGTENVSALDVGKIQLSSLFSADGTGILAWDWSLYNAAETQNISLTGLAGQNVPEPATWGMLLLGISFLLRRKRAR